jgi:large subunit ribosomal protein L3
MVPSLLGTKIGMTRILGDRGLVEAVTVVQAGPCVALQIKTKDTDGYEAVQLGLGDVKPHRSNLPMIGHASKARCGPKSHLAEVRLDDASTASQGDVLTVDLFAGNDVKYVDVTGTTKGKGFAGVMKRHGFGGKEASHGVERKHRSAGSIGGHSTRGTGRGVKKGKRMAGHMGHQRRTIGPLRLLKVDTENGLLLIRGSVPGAAGSVVMVRVAKKRS